MADQDFEIISSADMWPSPRVTTPFRRSAIVLYDCTAAAPSPDIIRKIDDLGHVAIFPHGVSQIPALSARAYPYRTNEPYGAIANDVWQQILEHSHRLTGRRAVTQVIVIDNNQVLATGDQLRQLLFSWESRMEFGFGMTIELIRQHPQEAWWKVLHRYSEFVRELDFQSQIWSPERLNGIVGLTWGDASANEVQAAVEARNCLLQRIPQASAGRLYLESRVLAWTSWTLGATDSVLQATDRLFLSLGNNGRDWERISE